MNKTEFKDLKFEPHAHIYAGFDTNATTTFDNGYGVSVVTGPSAYTSPEEPYELAVLGPDGRITFDTPIADDVVGYLTALDVEMYLERIAALPTTTTTTITTPNGDQP